MSVARGAAPRLFARTARRTFAVYLVAACDALLYAFFPVCAALFLRCVQRRTLLARFGKRNVLVLDVPQVQQCATAFAQKLFSLSFGLCSVDVSGANPQDHAVHRTLHGVCRGTLVVLGVPDGRLRALIDAECAAYLSVHQIKSIANWGVGAEVVTVGHHTYSPEIVSGCVILDSTRPAFLSEMAHGASPTHHKTEELAASSQAQRQTVSSNARRVSFLSPTNRNTRATLANVFGADALVVRAEKADEEDQDDRPRTRAEERCPSMDTSIRGPALSKSLESHAIVEALYEGRVACLERQLGLYVLFHSLAQRAATALKPFGFGFDTWRSQAGTRVATTPSPTSPASSVTPHIDRVVNLGSFNSLAVAGPSKPPSKHSLSGVFRAISSRTESATFSLEKLDRSVHSRNELDVSAHDHAPSFIRPRHHHHRTPHGAPSMDESSHSARSSPRSWNKTVSPRSHSPLSSSSSFEDSKRGDVDVESGETVEFIDLELVAEANPELELIAESGSD